MDREHNGPVMIGSPHGGMDIEQVAVDDPESIYTVGIIGQECNVISSQTVQNESNKAY